MTRWLLGDTVAAQGDEGEQYILGVEKAGDYVHLPLPQIALRKIEADCCSVILVILLRHCRQP